MDAITIISFIIRCMNKSFGGGGGGGGSYNLNHIIVMIHIAIMDVLEQDGEMY